MSPSSPFLRQWILLRSIAAADGQTTVKSLVRQTGVSEKTIRRNLDQLREVGFPIVEAVGEFGRKTFSVPASHLPPLGFTFDEALALFFCRRAVFITYRSGRSTEPLTYDIHPYGLIEHRGSLYLVGHSRQHDEIRHWKVDRVEAVDPTNVPFQRPANFDLERHLAGSFGIFQGTEIVKVRVRFAASAARYVNEKKMHASQRIEQLRDGGVIVDFELSSTPEVKSWILSFGATAEVLAPPSLRDEVATELRQAIQNYAPAATKGDDTNHAAKPRDKRVRAPR